MLAGLDELGDGGEVGGPELGLALAVGVAQLVGVHGQGTAPGRGLGDRVEVDPRGAEPLEEGGAVAVGHPAQRQGQHQRGAPTGVEQPHGGLAQHPLAQRERREPITRARPAVGGTRGRQHHRAVVDGDHGGQRVDGPLAVEHPVGEQDRLVLAGLGQRLRGQETERGGERRAGAELDALELGAGAPAGRAVELGGEARGRGDVEVAVRQRQHLRARPHRRAQRVEPVAGVAGQLLGLGVELGEGLLVEARGHGAALRRPRRGRVGVLGGRIRLRGDRGVVGARRAGRVRLVAVGGVGIGRVDRRLDGAGRVAGGQPARGVDHGGVDQPGQGGVVGAGTEVDELGERPAGGQGPLPRLEAGDPALRVVQHPLAQRDHHRDRQAAVLAADPGQERAGAAVGVEVASRGVLAERVHPEPVDAALVDVEARAGHGEGVVGRLAGLEGLDRRVRAGVGDPGADEVAHRGPARLAEVGRRRQRGVAEEGVEVDGGPGLVVDVGDGAADLDGARAGQLAGGQRLDRDAQRLRVALVGGGGVRRLGRRDESAGRAHRHHDARDPAGHQPSGTAASTVPGPGGRAQ